MSQLASLARAGGDEHEVIRMSCPLGRARAKRPSGDSERPISPEPHGRRAVRPPQVRGFCARQTGLHPTRSWRPSAERSCGWASSSHDSSRSRDSPGGRPATWPRRTRCSSRRRPRGSTSCCVEIPREPRDQALTAGQAHGVKADLFVLRLATKRTSWRRLGPAEVRPVHPAAARARSAARAVDRHEIDGAIPPVPRPGISKIAMRPPGSTRTELRPPPGTRRARSGTRGASSRRPGGRPRAPGLPGPSRRPSRPRADPGARRPPATRGRAFPSSGWSPPAPTQEPPPLHGHLVLEGHGEDQPSRPRGRASRLPIRVAYTWAGWPSQAAE